MRRAHGPRPLQPGGESPGAARGRTPCISLLLVCSRGAHGVQRGAPVGLTGAEVQQSALTGSARLCQAGSSFGEAAPTVGLLQLRAAPHVRRPTAGGHAANRGRNLTSAHGGGRARAGAWRGRQVSRHGTRLGRDAWQCGCNAPTAHGGSRVRRSTHTAVCGMGAPAGLRIEPGPPWQDRSLTEASCVRPPPAPPLCPVPPPAPLPSPPACMCRRLADRGLGSHGRRWWGLGRRQQQCWPRHVNDPGAGPRQAGIRGHTGCAARSSTWSASQAAQTIAPPIPASPLQEDCEASEQGHAAL